VDRNIDLDKITKRINEVIESTGMRFYDLDYNSLSRTLRVYIDKEKGGVTIGDCQKVSAMISRELGETDLINFPYTLEVSSPGVERVLKRPEHYSWAIGKVVEIDTGERKITGYLRDIENEGVVVATGTGESTIQYSSIKRAKVVEELIHGKRR
jgi:ribosome maturation factor RimP